ncbi:MAG: hypothetical protein AAFP84_15205 [Actinomycetota bacterium]
MGLVNARNLRKAKELLEKNRHKAGDIVGKAGEKLDKVSKGKTSSLTAKATEAANKYADGAVDRHDFGEASGDHDGMPDDQRMPNARASGADVAAANAMTNMANAATNFLNTAAAQAQSATAHQQDAARGTADDASVPPPPPSQPGPPPQGSPPPLPPS